MLTPQGARFSALAPYLNMEGLKRFTLLVSLTSEVETALLEGRAFRLLAMVFAFGVPKRDLMERSQRLNQKV